MSAGIACLYIFLRDVLVLTERGGVERDNYVQVRHTRPKQVQPSEIYITKQLYHRIESYVDILILDSSSTYRRYRPASDVLMHKTYFLRYNDWHALQ